jgi:hypothetical protein
MLRAPSLLAVALNPALHASTLQVQLLPHMAGAGSNAPQIRIDRKRYSGAGRCRVRAGAKADVAGVVAGAFNGEVLFDTSPELIAMG